MKVAQEIDVDNVTIIINPQNKLEAKIPTTSNEVVIEEVTGITNFSDSNGNYADAPFSINKGGQQYPITKVGRIVGTNWLVFQTDAPLVADEPVTPVQPEPEQPPSDTPIHTFYDVSCGTVTALGDHYEMSTPVRVNVTTSDTGGKTPQTVKFDVTLGSQTRTYSYPYSAGNTYYWSSIGDFNYEGDTSYGIGNARVEFTDGSVSLPPLTTPSRCGMMAVPD